MGDYTLIRTDRKSVGIKITPEGKVEVRAPKRLPLRDIEKILSAHTDFIEKGVARQKKLAAEREAHIFAFGDKFLFLGREYPLRKADGYIAGYDGESFYLPVGLYSDEIAAEMTEIYKRLARKVIPDVVGRLSEKMGLYPTRVSINSAKTRWGSCGPKNTLNFSWRLVLASPETVDAVVIHELAHIKHRNHGADFKKTVAAYAADPDRADRELKELYNRLAAEGWK